MKKTLKKLVRKIGTILRRNSDMTKADKIREIAAKLDVNPVWLDGVIAFESNYNPQAKNPSSSARGLIQFVDMVAREMGFADSADLVAKQPTFDAQMDGAVYQYLAKKKPFLTEQDLYMAVFYPAYRRVASDTLFPDSVQKVNPGIKTPQDYINFVNRKVAAIRLIPAAGTLALLAVGVGVWLLARGKII